MTAFTESVVEYAALAWVESLGYPVKHGLEIAPGDFSPMTATRAKNATVRFWSNVQKMHIAVSTNATVSKLEIVGV